MSTLIQDQVIALLAAGQTITSAAAALNLHRTTIHAWKRTDPDFADALRDAQTDAAAHTRARYQVHAAAALAVLVELMNNPNTAASVRLKAALYLLNQSAIPAPKPETKQERQQARLLRLRLDPPADAADDPQNSSLFITPGNTLAEPPAATLPTLSIEELQAHLDRCETAMQAREATLDVREASLYARQQNSSPVTTFVRPGPKVGRNEPCPCGSNRKFKQCCLNKTPAAAA